MAGLLSKLKPLGTGNTLLPGLDKQFSNFFNGNSEEHDRVSNLLPGQMPLYEQLQSAAQGPGAGGAYGDAADYYRGLMDENSPDYKAFSAPEQRRYNEQIIPDLAEQFAGMGSGNLDSSGFRNAAVSAGTDLSERLGAIRAQLRERGAAGLAGIGQQALGNFSNDVITQQGTEGAISQLGPALAGGAIGFATGGPAGAAVGAAGPLLSGLGNQNSRKGKSSPFGNKPGANVGQGMNPGFNTQNIMNR